MNANNIKTPPFYLKIYFFLDIFLAKNLTLSKLAKIMKTQIFIKLSMTAKAIESHIRPRFC